MRLRIAPPEALVAHLSVNLNKIAWLRNGRAPDAVPSLLQMANIVLDAGADGVTVHPRPDLRHITPADVEVLAKRLKTAPAGVEFNIEGNPFATSSTNYPGFMTLIEHIKPDQCTLVPDADNQLTSDHGFSPSQLNGELKTMLAQIKSWGVRTSIFMDPVPQQMALAAAAGADRVELYTGSYAKAYVEDEAGEPINEVKQIWSIFASSAAAAGDAGLGVNAGHDLDLSNLAYFLQILEIDEVSIGHALISDALKLGLAETVRRYKAITQLNHTS